jgi:hypothetical protein
MSRYKALRVWSVVLTAIGFIGVVMAVIGTLSLACSIEGVWEKVGVIMLGGPFALLLATLPFALGQALRVLADLGDSVVFDPERALSTTSL